MTKEKLLKKLNKIRGKLYNYADKLERREVYNLDSYNFDIGRIDMALSLAMSAIKEAEEIIKEDE